MQTSLPFDILAEVLQILANANEMDQIKRISYLSSLCRDECRKHIFHTIEAGGDSRYITSIPTITKFRSLILEHPIVIPYIRDFTLSECSDDPELPRVLGHLTHLSRLEISMDGRQNWTDTLTETLKAVSHLNCLQHLSLRHVGDTPLSAIACLPYIKHLALFNTSFLHETHTARDGILHPMKLASLTFYWTDILPLHLLEWNGRPLVDNSGVSVLHFNVAVPRAAEHVSQLLNSQVNKLESIQQMSFRVGYYIDEDIHSQTLQNHIEGWISPHRRTLQILAITIDKPWAANAPDIYSGLCRALGHMAGDNVLTRLEVNVILTSRLDAPRQKIAQSSWTPLTDVLRRTGWKHLSSVCITVQLRCERYDNGVEDLESIFDCLRSQPFLFELKIES